MGTLLTRFTTVGLASWFTCMPALAQRATKPAAQLSPPTLEIVAVNYPRPPASSWSVQFRLHNNWVARQPLTGWITAIAYDASDVARERGLSAHSYPIAGLQAGGSIEGVVVFESTGSIRNGTVQLTYIHISSGYVPGAPSSDGVLPDVPARVKARLLKSGRAKALSTATADFTPPPLESRFMSLPESASEEAKKLAVVFDFDKDSCYPSPAISGSGLVNPGLEEQAPGITAGCREKEQLENSNTYYRKATMAKNGVQYAVHMYALYFMKDKTVHTALEPGIGHRHDWEYALVWTTNGVLTHATVSVHRHAETEPRHLLPVRVVYHKDEPWTHAFRFANSDDSPENDTGRWFTPTLVDWHTMYGPGVSNATLRDKLNTHDFDEADCSVNDTNFLRAITKQPPEGYPSADEWRAALRSP